MKYLLLAGLLGAAACTSLPQAGLDGPAPPVAGRARMPAAVQANPSLTARQIIARAHEAAGDTHHRRAAHRHAHQHGRHAKKASRMLAPAAARLCAAPLTATHRSRCTRGRAHRRPR